MKGILLGLAAVPLGLPLVPCRLEPIRGWILVVVVLLLLVLLLLGVNMPMMLGSPVETNKKEKRPTPERK